MRSFRRSTRERESVEFSPGSSALGLALALVVHHEHDKRKTNWTGHSTACHYRNNQLVSSTCPELADVGSRYLCRSKSRVRTPADRKSTRLNSSHGYISYAVFCLKKKKKSSRDTKSIDE